MFRMGCQSESRFCLFRRVIALLASGFHFHTCDHERHAALSQVRWKRTECYPEVLCQAYAKGLQKFMNKSSTVSCRGFKIVIPNGMINGFVQSSQISKTFHCRCVRWQIQRRLQLMSQTLVTWRFQCRFGGVFTMPQEDVSQAPLPAPVQSPADEVVPTQASSSSSLAGPRNALAGCF